MKINMNYKSFKSYQSNSVFDISELINKFAYIIKQNEIIIGKINSTEKAISNLRKDIKYKEIFFIVLDKSIVQNQGINENDTFLEQELTEDGVLMRIKKFNPGEF